MQDILGLLNSSQPSAKALEMISSVLRNEKIDNTEFQFATENQATKNTNDASSGESEIGEHRNDSCSDPSHLESSSASNSNSESSSSSSGSSSSMEEEKQTSQRVHIVPPAPRRLLRNDNYSDEYLNLPMWLKILVKTLNPSLFSLYQKSIIASKDGLSLTQVGFKQHRIIKESIKPPKIESIAKRKGYLIVFIEKVYEALRQDQVVIKDLSDFRLYVLPIYYLLHGEEYSSKNPSTMLSYNIVH
jgi:hypothetical protein